MTCAATLSRTTTRRLAYTTLGMGAASVALAGPVSASPLSDATAQLGLTPPPSSVANSNQSPVQPATPTPQLPSLPSIFEQAEGMLPSNLLRKNSVSADATVQPTTTPATVVNTYAGDDVVQPPAQTPPPAPAPVQGISPNLLNAHDAWNNDLNTAAQQFGAVTVPTAETVNAMSADVQQLAHGLSQDLSNAADWVNKVSTGEINPVQDVATRFDNAVKTATSSEAFQNWSTRADILDNIDNSLGGADRAASGVSHLVDSFTIDPLGTTSRLIEVAGGMGRIVADPIGAVASVTTYILGPEASADISTVAREAVGNLGKTLGAPLLSLLAIPAGAVALGIPGALLGTANGAPLGALLGTLNPLSFLGGLAGAIPGVLLGGLATAIPGFIGSLLFTLPMTAITPLLGATSASAIVLAIWVTVIFGTYALALTPLWITTFIVANLLSAGLLAFSLFISALNPVAFFPAVLISFWPAVYFWAFLFSASVVFTAWIPILFFAVTAPIVTLLSIIPGSVVGGLVGLAIPLIGVPLLTALSSIPGAIAGNLSGFLLGDGLAKLLNTVLGAGLGGLIGVGLGSLLGSQVGGFLGALAAPIIGLMLLAYVGSKTWGNWFNNSPALQRLADAWNRGYAESNFNRMFGDFGRSLYDQFGFSSETTQAWNDLWNRAGSLFAGWQWSDGGLLGPVTTRGSLLGGALGTVLIAIPGAIIGAMLGALNPLNLVNGLVNGVALSIPGALLGAFLGSLFGPLVGFPVGLGSIPLTFLPNLALALGTLTLLSLPAFLASFAVTIIPPLVLAASLVIILWGLSYFIPSTITILTAGATSILYLLSQNTALRAATPQFITIYDIVGGAFGIISIALASINTITGLAWFITLNAVVGIPTFLILLPLFSFPALLVSLGYLASLPGLGPIALGMSLLESVAIGSVAAVLTDLLSIPDGALLGGLIAGLAGTVIGTTVSALLRAPIHSVNGALVSSILGAPLSTLAAGLGALLALITHIRPSAGVSDGAAWVDNRIVNHVGIGDSLSWVPGLGGTPHASRGAVPVPTAALPTVVPMASRENVSINDADALVAA